VVRNPGSTSGFVREPSDTKGLDLPRVIVGGIDERYFERRLADLERYLRVVGDMGATVISWG
jgi:hypothetical protein